MADQEDVRRFALAQPDALEQPHHERTSFRVGGKIFATMKPGEATANLALPPPLAVELLEQEPDALSPINWGALKGWVSVDLSRASPRLLEELVSAAWTRAAPGRAGGRARPTEPS